VRGWSQHGAAQPNANIGGGIQQVPAADARALCDSDLANVGAILKESGI
jgi:hypothetical protein